MCTNEVSVISPMLSRPSSKCTTDPMK
jgi:hypothetical protein